MHEYGYSWGSRTGGFAAIQPIQGILYRVQVELPLLPEEMEGFVTTVTSNVGLELCITASGGVRVAGVFRKQAVYAFHALLLQYDTRNL